MIVMLKKEKLNILILSFLFLILSFVTFLKQSIIPIVDFGREVYIPSQMVKGEVLFKDIFNIFGPLSYQINALAFKLFGTNISILNILGLINSYIILIFTYFLSRKFLSRALSFAVSIFLICTSIYQVGIFNYNLPYSYAAVYALSSVLISVYFFISFFENRNQKLLYLSTFFLGCSIAFKYDYLLFAFFVFIYLILKKVDYKIILKSILSFFIPIIVSFFILFIQGVTLKDLVTHIILLSKMAKTPSLLFLYNNVAGMKPSVEAFIQIGINFLYVAIILSIFYLSFYLNNLIKIKLEKHKLLSILLKLFFIIPIQIYLIVIVTIYCNRYIFIMVPLLTLIILISNFKKIIKTSSILILFIVTLISSLKYFYNVNILVYASLGVPFVSIMFCYIFLNFLTFKDKLNKKYVEISLCIILLGISFQFIITTIYSSIGKNIKIINYTNECQLINDTGSANIINKEVKEIIKLTNENDTVLIMPEGHILNYLSNRKSDNFYHTYMPPYIEFFGENNIINHLKQNSPTLIVINKKNLNDYGHTYICKSYAKDLCTWVYKNYEFESIIGEGNYQFINYKKRK